MVPSSSKLSVPTPRVPTTRFFTRTRISVHVTPRWTSSSWDSKKTRATRLASRRAGWELRRTALGLVHTHVSLALAPTVLYVLAGWRLHSRGRGLWASAVLMTVSLLFFLLSSLPWQMTRVTAAAWPGLCGRVCVAVHAARVVAVRFFSTSGRTKQRSLAGASPLPTKLVTYSHV